MMSDQDLHYLKSILAQLRELRDSRVHGPTLSGQILADNIDWLDCFIDKHERYKKAAPGRDTRDG